MSWLGRLIGRGPQMNPEEYERVVCNQCDGTGHPKTAWSALYPSARDWREPCFTCHGRGYVMAKRGLAEESVVPPEPVSAPEPPAPPKDIGGR